MQEIFISFFGVFAATYFLTPITNKLGLLDKPDHRKHHEGAIPLVGGIAMFASTALAALFFVPSSIEMSYLLAACALLTMTGSIDDKYNISYRLRLIIQIIATVFMIKGTNICLHSFGDLFGLGEIELGVFSIPVTVIAVVGMINAFNMIDGIDGLAGGLALISSISLYILVGNQISDGATNILLLMIGALSAYLILNLHLLPKWTTKIFMGDAGSMLLGFILTAFLIRYSQGTKEVLSPVTALWIVAVPLMDIFVTTIRRVKRGKSPFHPDRTHIHHILIRAGFSNRTTLVIVLSTQAAITTIGLSIEHLRLPDLYSMVAFTTLLILYIYFIKHSFKASKWIRKRI